MKTRPSTAVARAPSLAATAKATAQTTLYGLADQDDTVTRGRRADLVLLDTDPLQDFPALRRRRAVIVGGRVLDRAALEVPESQLLRRGE